jgi:lipopolysaccharide transport protein LptA
MAASLRSNRAIAAMLAALLALGATAQDQRRQQPISLDAASSDIDYPSNRVRFRDVTITQGETTVQAERAEATGLEFADSRWEFEGDVRIRVPPQGELRSQRAVVVFKANRIESATITGQPAEFEQQREDSDLMARGRAGSIEYSVGEGIVRLSEDAWLTDGRNEITGPLLVYNIRAQRVQAATEPGGKQRVRITINPPATETPRSETPQSERRP